MHGDVIAWRMTGRLLEHRRVDGHANHAAVHALLVEQRARRLLLGRLAVPRRRCVVEQIRNVIGESCGGTCFAADRGDLLIDSGATLREIGR